MPDTRALGKELGEKIEQTAAEAETENPGEPETEPAEPAEPETGDEEAETEEQPAEPEPQGRRGKSPQQQFEAALSAFAGKLKRIFEVDDLVPAPHPGVVGFMLPGFAEPRTHDNYTMCSTCNGRGFVLTGAVTGKPENDQHVCPDTRCKGRGYWEKSSAVPQAVTTGPLAVTPPTEPNGEYADAPAWLGDPNLTPAA